ncbi:cupin domain-containing protein [Saccharomonospora glauca]|jgi:gentisate 1,2-dioxygenase|uniref:Gentisate 1,2-dioxygenase n=1 Tax=Saccharomonospora glauca K62 TaxID=928724 RepID=I1D2X0_9PSEU|nr:cupin domain-containing protein [Saccharomonospora glauca]EIE99294.1 gentisate 1,2-dioxygenase [Saccharomonospora glauca K62]
MTTTPATGLPDPASVTSLDELYALFDELSMEGGWHRRSPALWPEPRKNLLPARWSYADIKSVLDAAGRLVDHSMADRRNVTLTNPAEGNIYPTVRTLVAAYQLIRPGETADAHRHTPSALRIILEGRGTSTVVNGVRLEMRPGDVLLTPSYAWHSHSAAGPDDCYWVDILDVPLIHLLEPMFFERHPDELESDVVDAEESPLAFRWEDSLERLAAQRTAPEHGMAEREIQLGDPALRTIALHVQQMSAGFRSATSRTTANSIFTVLRGSGETEIDGEVFSWEKGDIIAVPAWRPYRHRVSADAYLVRASDEPVMRAFDLLRTTTA